MFLMVPGIVALSMVLKVGFNSGMINEHLTFSFVVYDHIPHVATQVKRMD